MSTPESEPSMVPPAAGSSPPPSATDAPVVVAGPARASWIWVPALLAGLVAGLVATMAGEEARRSWFFGPSAEAAAEHYDFRRLNAETAIAAPKNAAIAYGLLGATLGLLLGLTGGLARRSVPAGLGAGVLGMVLAAALAVGASFAIVPTFMRVFDKADPNLVPLVLTRGGLGAALGAAAGLALGLGLGGGRRAVAGLVGGLIGAIVGTVAAEMITSIAFSTARNDWIIPSLEEEPNWRILLVSRLCVALGVALGAALAVRGPKPEKARVPDAV